LLAASIGGQFRSSMLLLAGKTSHEFGGGSRDELFVLAG